MFRSWQSCVSLGCFLSFSAYPQDAAGTVNMIVLQLGRGTGAQLGAIMNTTSFATSQADPWVGGGGWRSLRYRF